MNEIFLSIRLTLSISLLTLAPMFVNGAEIYKNRKQIQEALIDEIIPSFENVANAYAKVQKVSSSSPEVQREFAYLDIMRSTRGEPTLSAAYRDSVLAAVKRANEMKRILKELNEKPSKVLKAAAGDLWLKLQADKQKIARMDNEFQKYRELLKNVGQDGGAKAANTDFKKLKIPENWKFISTLGDKEGGNLSFYWQYGPGRASINLRTVNNYNVEISKFDVRVTAGKTIKKISIYRVKPGKWSRDVIVASLLTDAYKDVKDVTVEFLEFR